VEKPLDTDLLISKAKERTVRTQTIEYDLETLVKKLDKRYIILNPDYQRNHRWNNSTSSKLIESLILNIPIPLIYISQDISADDEIEEQDTPRFSVIDGQQRLTAIYNFFKNNFRLENLEVLHELNGYMYKDLPSFLIRRLEERMIRCLRIDSTLDRQIKYDIFERLNSGAVQLGAQELRNATCSGPFNTLIKELSKNQTFIKICLLSPKIDSKTQNINENPRVKKMENEELVLRYFAISYESNHMNYNDKMNKYLTKKMEEFNTLPEEKLEDMRRNFEEKMIQISETFTKYPFAKYTFDAKTGRKKIKSRFNAAIFDVVCTLVNKSIDLSEDQKEKYFSLFKNPDFISATEGSVTDINKVKGRINLALKELGCDN
jgi:hypothetical protein